MPLGVRVPPSASEVLHAARAETRLPAAMGTSSVVIVHPNRDKPEAKATKAAVILLLVTSAALTAIVTLGGWSKLQGAQPFDIFYIVVYAAMAYYAAQWNRGVLPVAAALALILAIFAIVAGPGWFDRDKEGFEDPSLPPGMLGLLTLLLIPVQFLLIAFTLRGFNQNWNVEVEVAREEYEREGFQARDVEIEEN
jgi:hypothetical protein